MFESKQEVNSEPIVQDIIYNEIEVDDLVVQFRALSGYLAFSQPSFDLGVHCINDLGSERFVHCVFDL